MHSILDGFVPEAVVRMPKIQRWSGLLPHKMLRDLSRAALGNRGAAIGKQQRSRHETRLIRGHEGENVGHLLRCAASTEYRARDGLLLHLGIHRTGLLVRPGRIDRTGADAERTHAILTLFVCHPAHEGMEKTL